MKPDDPFLLVMNTGDLGVNNYRSIWGIGRCWDWDGGRESFGPNLGFCFDGCGGRNLGSHRSGRVRRR